jgi:hypothetical protein
MGWPRGLYEKWSQELESESRVLIKFRGIYGGAWRVLENRECVRALDRLAARVRGCCWPPGTVHWQYKYRAALHD